MEVNHKILIAGLGSIGHRHLMNLKALGCDNFVLYRTGQSSLANDDLKSLPTMDNLDEALASKPYVSIISNPTFLHLATSLSAAKAGSHLFIEKPVSNSLDGLDELASVANKKRLKVMVGFQLRFHPGLLIIKQLLEEKAIGDIVYAKAHWGEYLPEWHPWEDYRKSYSAKAEMGGGVILTLCHPLDYLRWLMGDIKSVSAMSGELGGLELLAEDIAQITLKFESGAIGSVHLDYIERPKSHWVQISGHSGTIKWDEDDGSVSLFRSGKGEWERFDISDAFQRNDMFLAEMKNMLKVMEGVEEPAANLADGIVAVEACVAAKRSALEGVTVNL